MYLTTYISIPEENPPVNSTAINFVSVVSPNEMQREMYMLPSRLGLKFYVGCMG